MEIKTSEQLQLKKIDDWDKQFYSSLWLKRKWVSVFDVLEWIDNLRKSNDMWRYAVDECFGMLEDAITSTSHNTDYDFGSEKESQPKGKICPICKEKLMEYTKHYGTYVCINCEKFVNEGKISSER
jgi:hypothetical protein